MSNDDLFKKAKDSLIPRDFYLRESILHMKRGFEPKYHTGELVVQNKQNWKEFGTGDLYEPDDDKTQPIKLFRVEMELGIRFCNPEIKDIEDQESDEALEHVNAELSAIIIAEYQISIDNLEQDALKMFAERNVIYHVWPFWREFVMNMVARSNLPQVVLPTVQV